MSTKAPWVWHDHLEDVEVRFVGRGVGDGLEERELILAAAEAEEAGEGALPGLAWARQIHSAEVLPGRQGFCGEGDALVSGARGLALSVITADCVPVLIAGRHRLAAVHAGWRGLAAGIVGKALADLGETPEEVTAWIGPAIGRCCYEVGHDVAEQVTAASSPDVAHPGPASRPHLDVQAAAHRQLEVFGVRRIHSVVRCTRCHPEDLFSYRRDGPGAGRNLAVIWRR